MAKGRPLTLRARVRHAIGLIVVVALLLFGVPLAVGVDRLIGSTALAGLQRDATRAVAKVPDNVIETGTGLVAPQGTGSTRIGVYDKSGTLVAGIGPRHSALAAQVADGREHDGREAGALSVVVPVQSDTAVAGSVRAALPLSTLWARVYRAWALLALLAATVVVIAAALARGAARRISEPFEQITTAAQELGAGRYELGLPHWGIAEADAAGDALRDSAAAIDDLVRHERDFVRHASHQLRTPLSGVLLHLDQSPADVPAALASARHLETTIADLLALRAVSGSGRCSAQQVAAESVQRWDSAERAVTLRTDSEVGDVSVSTEALRQVLDVLLDNAFRHGAGDVTVTVEPHGDTVIVEVADLGRGFPEGKPPGTGLRLATSIVERAGGSLVIRRWAPHPRVAVLLPRAPDPAPAQPTSNR
ncbi:MAG: hypothetical protein QOI76_3180 [Frankiales bacterium]|jgi:signal transduction histidine kinase|nr:hypothetical protein [Frankiales bacterium]